MWTFLYCCWKSVSKGTVAVDATERLKPRMIILIVLVNGTAHISTFQVPLSQIHWNNFASAALANKNSQYLLSTVQLFATPMDCCPPGSSLHGFSRQEYWSRLPSPSPGDLPNPGVKPTSLTSPALAGGFFNPSAIWEGQLWPGYLQYHWVPGLAGFLPAKNLHL